MVMTSVALTISMCRRCLRGSGTPCRSNSARFHFARFALALLVLFLVIEFAGDTMYGITGVAYWYVAGQAVAIVDSARRPVGADPRVAVRDTFAPGYS